MCWNMNHHARNRKYDFELFYKTQNLKTLKQSQKINKKRLNEDFA